MGMTSNPRNRKNPNFVGPKNGTICGVPGLKCYLNILKHFLSIRNENIQLIRKKDEELNKKSLIRKKNFRWVCRQYMHSKKIQESGGGGEHTQKFEKSREIGQKAPLQR